MHYFVIAVLLILQCFGIYRSMYKDKGLRQKMLTSTAFLAVAAYTLFSVKANPTTFGVLIFCGIVASYLGDWLISYKVLGMPGILGIVFFAAAHIFYISAYTVRFTPTISTLWLLVPFAALLIFEITAKKRLNIKLDGAMKFAVLMYAVIINSMVLLGIRLGINRICTEKPLDIIKGIILIAGVIMFMISDAGVCMNMFSDHRKFCVGKKQYSIDNFNIVTYNLGQFFIAISILI